MVMPQLRLALRTLFKTPFVTLVAVLSLALGIGANSAIFSLYHQMLLRPLPVPRPAELVNLGAPGPKSGSNSCSNIGSCEDVFSYPMFRDLERAQASFTGIASHKDFGASIGFQGTTLSGDGLLVSGSYFPVLELTPALGRLFTPDDDKTVGSQFVVVISHDYWRSRFELNPAILNQTLIVNGQALTVIGVAPAGFQGTTLGSRYDVFVPLTMRGLMSPGFNGFENRRQYWAYLFARLKPGVSMEQATTAINGPYRAIINDVEAPLQKGASDQTMARFKAKQITVVDGRRGQSDVDREASAPLTILFVVTGTVLLIACANIANLLLVRGAGRSAEMAVRLSIGASRTQLIAQLLTESCLLAAFGAVGGLLVAKWTLDLIGTIVPPDAAGMVRFRMDPMMLAFGAASALLTGIAFGLFPALHSTKPDLVTTIKNQAGQPGGARAARRFRTTLATVQIAMSMALLVPAGLFAKSLMNVSRVELGLKTDHLVVFSLAPELIAYSTERTRALFERVEDELSSTPGVTGVVATLVPILAGDNWGNSMVVEGFQAGPDTNTNASFNGVGPGFLKTMGIPLIAGREFTRADAPTAPKVAIVNQEFVKKFNLGDNPLGKRIAAGGGRDAKPDIEIVGVVRDAKYSDVKRVVPPQVPPAVPARGTSGLRVLLRADGAAARAAAHLDSRDDEEARREPPGRGSEDDGDADSRKRLPRSTHQHAVGRFRAAGHRAGLHRSVRCAGLHRGAANTGVRASHGTGRRRGQRPGHRHEAGRLDVVDRRRDWPRRCSRSGTACPIHPVRAQGLGPDSAYTFCHRARPGCPRCRVHSGAARVADRSDECAEIRVGLGRFAPSVGSLASARSWTRRLRRRVGSPR